MDDSSIETDNTLKVSVKIANKGNQVWLNGGRDNVRLSYGNYLPHGDDEGTWLNTTFYQYYRFWHDAPEAYINLGNYRVSYYMNDTLSGVSASGDQTGWKLNFDNVLEMKKYGYYPENGGTDTDVICQRMDEDADGKGVWNQRITVRFPSVLSAASSHLFDNPGNAFACHKGVKGPCFFRIALKAPDETNMKIRVDDEWSYSKDAVNDGSRGVMSGESCKFHPVSPGWYSSEKYGETITNYVRHSCSPDVKGFDRVLVEEFDGYTWRRIQGNAPVSGIAASNVVVTDTIPLGFKWGGFEANNVLGVKATYTAAPEGADYTGVVTWNMPEMMASVSGTLEYKVSPEWEEGEYEKAYGQAAWISAKTDSETSSECELKLKNPQSDSPSSSPAERAEGDAIFPLEVSVLSVDGRVLGTITIPSANDAEIIETFKELGMRKTTFVLIGKGFSKIVIYK